MTPQKEDSIIINPSFGPSIILNRIYYLNQMTTHLGPRRVLCVVVVTMSAYSNGLGIRSAAMRPEMCAISAIRYAFCSSHTYSDRATDVGELSCKIATGFGQLKSRGCFGMTDSHLDS